MLASKFVESYFDAWNHSDPEGVADHLAANGTYRDVPENVQRSHDELITTLQEFFARYRHRYELIGDILSSDDAISFQYRMYPCSGQHKTGKAQACSGAEFMTLNGDAAVTITDYYDLPEMIQAGGHVAGKAAPPRKYARSGLDNDQLLAYQCRLEQIMRSEQAYLRSDLTLPKLAETVDCSVNHLSQVINAGFGVSFFDYLNRYRIAHAMELLSRQDDKPNAILNIAFTVGFSSNSAFYNAFKKRVGQTPAQFRKAQLSGSG